MDITGRGTVTNPSHWESDGRHHGGVGIRVACRAAGPAMTTNGGVEVRKR
jgi:hypothetical protein